MPKKILVVDDEKDIVRLVELALGANRRYEFLVAADGELALDLARREKPDLILLDVLIPKINGFAVCRALKRDPKTALTKVVFLSALGEEAVALITQQAGADEYVAKPFGPSAMVEKIENLLSS